MRQSLFICAAAALALAGCTAGHAGSAAVAGTRPPQLAQAPAPQHQAMIAADSRTEATVREDELRQAQRTLKAEGYYKGSVDGKSGPATVAALESFQSAHGLKRTGWLDQPTWSAIDRETYRAQATQGAVRTR